MNASVLPKVKFTKLLFVALAVFSAAFTAAPAASGAEPAVESGKGNLGTIKGFVRDETGGTIANAYVSIFRVGTSTLLKQVRSASDGSFLTKVLPGTYTILAVAEGFNPVTLSAVEVNRSAELIYGFKLEKSGGGNTLPEKRADRNSSKWTIRAAQTRRSIYQNVEGDAPIDETAAAETNEPENLEGTDDEIERPNQTVVETYFAGSGAGNFTGINFATLQPINENTEISTLR